MTEELEQSLRRALRPRQARVDIPDRVLARLASGAIEPTAPAPSRHPRPATLRFRWLPVALAASVVVAIGLVQLRQHALETTRANQARAQLLTALGIAAESINTVRATVNREEHPDS